MGVLRRVLRGSVMGMKVWFKYPVVVLQRVKKRVRDEMCLNCLCMKRGVVYIGH